jgi:hypothetical protein
MKPDFKNCSKVVCISKFYEDLTFGKTYIIKSITFKPVGGERYEAETVILSNDKNFNKIYYVKNTGLYNFIPHKLFRKIKLQKIENENKSR